MPLRTHSWLYRQMRFTHILKHILPIPFPPTLLNLRLNFLHFFLQFFIPFLLLFNTRLINPHSRSNFIKLNLYLILFIMDLLLFFEESFQLRLVFSYLIIEVNGLSTELADLGGFCCDFLEHFLYLLFECYAPVKGLLKVLLKLLNCIHNVYITKYIKSMMNFPIKYGLTSLTLNNNQYYHLINPNGNPAFSD